MSNTLSIAAERTRGYLLAARAAQRTMEQARQRFHHSIVLAHDRGASVADLAGALELTDLYITNVLRSHDRDA